MQKQPHRLVAKHHVRVFAKELARLDAAGLVLGRVLDAPQLAHQTVLELAEIHAEHSAVAIAQTIVLAVAKVLVLLVVLAVAKERVRVLAHLFRVFNI